MRAALANQAGSLLFPQSLSPGIVFARYNRYMRRSNGVTTMKRNILSFAGTLALAGGLVFLTANSGQAAPHAGTAHFSGGHVSAGHVSGARIGGGFNGGARIGGGFN